MYFRGRLMYFRGRRGTSGMRLPQCDFRNATSGMRLPECGFRLLAVWGLEVVPGRFRVGEALKAVRGQRGHRTVSWRTAVCSGEP